MTKRRILVVDDMPIVRTATALMLESIGYEVDQAASGLVAIKLFKPGYYAAIIMDFQMPSMNGFECCSKIREIESPENGRTPIICMSTAKDSNMKERCLAANLDDFLDKDCDIGELRATLSYWVSKTAS